MPTTPFSVSDLKDILDGHRKAQVSDKEAKVEDFPEAPAMPTGDQTVAVFFSKPQAPGGEETEAPDWVSATEAGDAEGDVEGWPQKPETDQSGGPTFSEES